jgi:uncharacterized membrane protein
VGQPKGANRVAGTPRAVVPSPIRRRLAVAAVILAALTGSGLLLLWPEGKGPSRQAVEQLGFITQTFDGRVTASREAPCPGAGPGSAVVCQRLQVALLEGPDRGQDITLELPISGARPRQEPGTVVLLGHQAEAAPGFEYILVDVRRTPSLLWLSLIFALAVVLLGRLRGLAALAGLAGTFVILLTFVLPAILEGTSPVLVAITGASAIAFLSLYLAHGLTSQSTIALLGTLASLALTAGLGTLFVDLSRLTGFATEEATFLNLGSTGVDIGGLVLAGLVLGALGALDDMTVSQTSAVFEIRSVSSVMPTHTLYRAGLRIGRDHVASTVNTLVLAYVGASLPLMLLFVLGEQSLGTVANSEVVATEIIRTLAGSIGLVAAVPVTTLLAAWSLPPRPEPEPDGSDPEDRPEPPPSFWMPERRSEAWRLRRRRPSQA